MRSSQSSQHRSGFMPVAALFLPRTWPSRLAFIAVILISASFPIPSPFKWITLAPGLILFIGPSLSMAFFGTISGNDDDNEGPVENLITVIVALLVILALLSFLVTNGQGFAPASKGHGHSYGPAALGWAEAVLGLALIWLLFGVPHQAYKVRLDKDGYAQRVLVGVITVAACILTGILLLSLHFGNGALSNLRMGPLITGIVFTVVLTAPIYKSVAQATWRDGFYGFFTVTALKKNWGKAAEEVQSALDQAARDHTKPFNNEDQEVHKTDQYSTVEVPPTDAERPTSATT